MFSVSTLCPGNDAKWAAGGMGSPNTPPDHPRTHLFSLATAGGLNGEVTAFMQFAGMTDANVKCLGSRV